MKVVQYEQKDRPKAVSTFVICLDQAARIAVADTCSTGDCLTSKGLL